MRGRGHAWQWGVHGSGACMAGGMRGGGHVWQGGVAGACTAGVCVWHGGCAWQGACMIEVCMMGGVQGWGHAWQGSCMEDIARYSQ